MARPEQERLLGEDGNPRKAKDSEDPFHMGLVLEWVYGTIVSTAEKARDSAKKPLGARTHCLLGSPSPYLLAGVAGTCSASSMATCASAAFVQLQLLVLRCVICGMPLRFADLGAAHSCLAHFVLHPGKQWMSCSGRHVL